MRKTTTHKKDKKTKNHTSKNQKRQKQDTCKNSKKTHRRTRKNKHGGMNFFTNLQSRLRRPLCSSNVGDVITPECAEIINIKNQISDVSNKSNKIDVYKDIVKSLSLKQYSTIIEEWNDTDKNKRLFIQLYLVFQKENLSNLKSLSTQYKNKALSNELSRSKLRKSLTPQNFENEIKKSEEIRQAMNVEATNENLEEEYSRLKREIYTEQAAITAKQAAIDAEQAAITAKQAAIDAEQAAIDAKHMAELEELYEKEELRKESKTKP